MSKKLAQIVKVPKPSLPSLDLDGFAAFAAKELDIDDVPKISRVSTDGSFGGYNPSTREITVSTKNRHPMDIYRTLAHEIVHHKQNKQGRIKDVAKEGSTGSDIENEANAQAGVIMRNYAKVNPKAFGMSAITEQVLNEGVNDPGIFKAVFLAGGPGSGKDYILKQTIAGNGLTEINSDIAFEFLMKKNKLDMKMPADQETERNAVREKGKVTSANKNMAALKNRQGMIINGTGANPDELAEIKKSLEDEYGYETMMVYVATADDVSKQRNIERGERGGRAVPEHIRSKKWKEAFAAKEKLTDLFGDNYMEVDNSLDLRNADIGTIKGKKDEFNKIFKRVKSFTSSKPKHPIAKQWIETEQKQRGIVKDVETKATKFADKRDKPAPKQKVKAKPEPTMPSVSDPRITYAKRPMQSTIMDKARSMGLVYYKFGRFGKNGKVTHIERNGQLIDAKMAESVNANFEHMITEVGGGGEWGTPELTNYLRKLTPGEENRVYAWAKNDKTKALYRKKYGRDAPAKLDEAVKKIMSAFGPEQNKGGVRVKTLREFRETTQTVPRKDK